MTLQTRGPSAREAPEALQQLVLADDFDEDEDWDENELNEDDWEEDEDWDDDDDDDDEEDEDWEDDDEDDDDDDEDWGDDADADEFEVRGEYRLDWN